MISGMTVTDAVDEKESLYWDIAESFIQDLNILDIALIESISIHLEGKMDMLLDTVSNDFLPPQESHEKLQELIWEEMKPMISEESSK